MHRRPVIAEAFRLRDEQGLGAVRVGKRLRVSAGTVRDWFAGKVPRHSRDLADPGAGIHPPCPRCGLDEHDFGALPPDYAYLLGLYLGDGSIARHRRGVYRLRVFLDLAYPGIISSCARAIAAVNPGRSVNQRARGGSYGDPGRLSNTEVSSYSKAWPCLVPQHGPGAKHTRRIWLAEWQRRLVERWPHLLLRGLIHSDGCRAINTGRGGWRHPRYAFSNASTDITSIFCTACDVLGLHWTASFPTKETSAVTIYVSRKADVARMDEFIGPKA